MPLSFYGLILRRYRKWILSTVLCFTAVATLIAVVLPKRYEATATVRIDPQGTRTVGEEAGANSIQFSARELVTTEAKVVQSPAVVMKTIEELHLDRDPEFSPDYKRLAASGQAMTLSQKNVVLRNVTKEISIDQPLGTFLLSVSFRASSPQTAASVANQLVQSLIEHDYSTRVRALMGSSQSMQAQVNDLRAKMEQSQKDLVDYESSHDVLAPDSKDNIMQARLTEVNQDLGVAQSKRIALEADYATIRSGDLDALLASPRGLSLVPLQNRLLRDQSRLAQDAQVYGPNFPLYREQAAVVAHDKGVLKSGEQHVARQIAAEYAGARAREELLRAELTLQKRRMDDFNLKAIRYHALKAAADSYSTLYYQLQQRIQDVAVAANLHSEMMRLISPALPDPKPVFPRPVLTAILTFLLSTILACSVAILAGLMDRRISNPEQVEHWFQLPVLAALPLIEGSAAVETANLLVAPIHRLSDGASGTPVLSPFREAIFNLHSALAFAQGGGSRQVLALTSTLPAEGKSTTSSHLACAFADLRQNTVLVDADLRKPTVHRRFGISNRLGLSTVLNGQCSVDEALCHIEGRPGLTILPAGPVPGRPVELLHLGMADLIEQLRARFECVILDCPPMLGFADAAAIGNLADGVVVIARAGGTERTQVLNTLRSLRAARANILGLVLNAVNRTHGSYYNYYETYQRYYGGEAEAVGAEP